MTQARTDNNSGLLVLFLVGVLCVAGLVGYKSMSPTKPKTPSSPSTSSPGNSNNPDKLDLTLRWKKHSPAVTSQATFGLDSGEEYIDFFPNRDGLENRTVMNPLSKGAVNYYIEGWNATDGLLMCEIRYTGPDGKNYLVTAGFTNSGGSKSNRGHYASCAGNVADIKAIIAKGLGK